MAGKFINGYALLIGVDENINPSWALPDVAKDVSALQKVLVHPERCAYLQDNVKVILGKDSTRQNILGGLNWLKQRITQDGSGNATAVVYYSGHGDRDDAQPPHYYLIPYDVNKDMFKSSALRAEDFADAINALNPQRLLVILDCCRSGGMGVKGAMPHRLSAIATHLFISAAKAISPREGARGLEVLTRGSGRAVLSSSVGEQESYLRKDGKMSIFTYHLIEALTGHAQPQEGATEVLVSDVMSYVWRKVPESARADCGAAQDPDYQVSGNFPIALLLGGKGMAKGQPAPDPLAPLASDRTTTVITIDTGGGAHIGGNVSVGRDFVGRDRVVHGDEIHGDYVGGDRIDVGDVSGTGIAIGRDARATVTKGIDGENVRINSVTIYQGTNAQAGTRPTAEPHEHAIEERLRLDVASPRSTVVNEPFDVVIAVRQPDTPKLTIADLDQVVSAEGSIFRTEESELVKYRIEVVGAGFQVTPASYLLKLAPRGNSQPIAFQVVATMAGRRSLYVNAYQEDGALAAQTRLSLEVTMAVQPG